MGRYRSPLIALALSFPLISCSQSEGKWLDAVFTGQVAMPSAPWTHWRTGHRLLVARPNAIEELDALTGASKTLVEGSRLASLAAKANLAELDPGSPVDAEGRYLAYLSGRNLAVLDLDARKLVKIDQGDIKDVQFSPDARQVAYAKDRDLYVADLATGTPRRLTRTDRPRLLNGVLTWVYWEEILGRREIAYHWSPDSRRILYLQTDESPVEETSFVDYRSLPPKVWKQTYPYAGQPNPKVRAGVIPAAGGTTVWLKPRDYEYILRTGWTPEGEPWTLTMNRRQTRTDLWTASPTTGIATHVLTDTNPAWIGLTDDIYFLKNRKGVLMNSQRDGYDRLYRFDRAGKLLNAITPPGKSIAPADLWIMNGLRHVDEKTGAVWLAMQEPDWRSVQVFRAHLDGSGYTRVSEAEGTHSPTVSPDGKAFVDAHSALERSPAVDVCDAAGQAHAHLQTPFHPSLPYAQAEMLSTPARDGYKLNAYLRKPANFDPNRRYPVIVNVYGGPGLPLTTNAWKDPTEQFFTDAGYLYFVVDPRTATTPDARTPRAIKGKAVGNAELNDVVDAVRWLKSQPYADGHRFGIWGWSGGGNFTLLALTRSEEFEAGMAGAPVTDWSFYDSFYTETLMGLPKENLEGYAATRRWPDAESLYGRLLLMYGTHDDNVHPLNEETFLQALIKAGKTCEVMVFPMRKHGFEDMEANRQMFTTMLEFFSRSFK